MTALGHPSNSPMTLWVKAEPFTYGALPVTPHPRLSFHNIKKIVSYAKTKGNAGFPKLSYSVWKHIACNKLQLAEEMAWLYFSAYNTLHINDPNEKLELDKRLAACATVHEEEKLKNQISVPILEFVLFLYIQHLHKISLRASFVSASDEWPMRTRSPDLESGRQTPTGAKSLNEHGHMMFVLNNLNSMLELLVEPDSYSGGTGGNDLTLSVDAVQALGFVIGASVDGHNPRPLYDAALLQQVQQKSGYSKRMDKVKVDVKSADSQIKILISRSFSFRNLQSWLRSNIGQNPFGIAACISTGRRMSWPLAGQEKEARENPKQGRIATNALNVPKEHIKGNRIIILSQVSKQTVARSSSTLEMSSVKVHRCHYSYLYLLSPLRSVSIERCRHSTIILGPVETTIHVNDCNHLTVIAPTRRICISSSTLCTLHVITPNRPEILGGNDSIFLAPYHTFYPKVEEHMIKAGLSTLPNNWDHPICLGPDHQDDEPVWELMQPKDFYLFSTPFEMEGTTKSVPGGIPARYQKALVQRDRYVESWQRMVKEVKLSRDHRKQFQALVEQRFQEWLADTGNKRQLDGLAITGNKSKEP